MVYFVKQNLRRYRPALEDRVVGIVEERAGSDGAGGDLYRINIGASHPALLSNLQFEGATKRNKPSFQPGQLLYARVSALHDGDTRPDGFSWIDADDAEQSVITFLRSDDEGDHVIVALNNTPVPRLGVHAGAPMAGSWSVLACSDDGAYGGSSMLSVDAIETSETGHSGHDQSLHLDLPPLSITFWRYDG